MLDTIRKVFILIVRPELNVYHWLITAILIFSILNFLYGKYVKLLLRRVGVKVKYVVPLMETMWDICFTTMSTIMIFFTCLEGSVLTDWVVYLDQKLTNCKIHRDVEIPGLKTVFILHIAYAVQDILTKWQRKNFKNLEFVQKQIFLATLILTNYSKCTTFGLSLMFLLNWSKLTELGSKLLFFFSKFTNSCILHNVSKGLCGISQLFWLFTFMYVYPMFLSHNKSVNSSMMMAELNMLIILDLLSWLYLVVSMVNCMLTRMTLCYLMASDQRPKTLEYFLFGSDPWLLKLFGSERSTVLVDDSPPPTGCTVNTICALSRCSIIFKRKAKNLRARKELEARMSKVGRNSPPLRRRRSPSRVSSSVDLGSGSRTSSGGYSPPQTRRRSSSRVSSTSVDHGVVLGPPPTL